MNNANLIDEMAQKLKNAFNGYPPITADDADTVGDLIAAGATYFEEHPQKWTRGTYHSVTSDRFCNVGLIWNGHNSPLANVYTLQQTMALARLERIETALVSMNDTMASSLKANIMGLRMTADILYHMAVNWSPTDAVDAVQKEYQKLYGNGNKMATDEVQARRDVKNQQVREARKQAKKLGYKSVTKMRLAGVK